tara:strand:- start:1728 stop:1868 length:141 start_codon:yes stop_codon:yes gene_type:complete
LLTFTMLDICTGRFLYFNIGFLDVVVTMGSQFAFIDLFIPIKGPTA